MPLISAKPAQEHTARDVQLDLLREAEAQRALADLFPHLKLDALRAIQDLFPLNARRQQPPLMVH